MVFAGKLLPGSGSAQLKRQSFQFGFHFGKHRLRVGQRRLHMDGMSHVRPGGSQSRRDRGHLRFAHPLVRFCGAQNQPGVVLDETGDRLVLLHFLAFDHEQLVHDSFGQGGDHDRRRPRFDPSCRLKEGCPRLLYRRPGRENRYYGDRPGRQETIARRPAGDGQEAEDDRGRKEISADDSPGPPESRAPRVLQLTKIVIWIHGRISHAVPGLALLKAWPGLESSEAPVSAALPGLPKTPAPATLFGQTLRTHIKLTRQYGEIAFLVTFGTAANNNRLQCLDAEQVLGVLSDGLTLGVNQLDQDGRAGQIFLGIATVIPGRRAGIACLLVAGHEGRINDRESRAPFDERFRAAADAACHDDLVAVAGHFAHLHDFLCPGRLGVQQIPGA